MNLLIGNNSQTRGRQRSEAPHGQRRSTCPPHPHAAGRGVSGRAAIRVYFERNSRLRSIDFFVR